MDFGYLKYEINQAGALAKVVIETNRLKTQINMKQQEIESKYRDIGKLMLSAYNTNDSSIVKNEVEKHCKEILVLQDTIKSMEKSIKELNNQKVCECGKNAPTDAKFCSFCGCRFPEKETISHGIEVKKICICSKEVPGDSKFCPFCGHELSGNKESVEVCVKAADNVDSKEEKVCKCGQAVPGDSRFCHICGQDFQ